MSSPPAPAAENRVSPARGWLVWLVAVLGAALSLIGTLQLRALEQRNLHLLAQDEVSARTTALEGDVRDAVLLATAARTVFDSSREVTRAEFATLARQLLPRTSVPAVLAWLPRVTRARRAAFEQEVRDTGLTAFFIYDREQPGALQPAPERAEYLPVLFVEPPGPNPPGFDPSANPGCLQALQRAADNAAPAADRLADSSLPHGSALAVVAPVYNSPFAPQTVIERRAALRGFVAAHIDLEAFVNASLTRSPRRMVTNTWLLDERGHAMFSRIEGGVAPPSTADAKELRQGLYFERVVQIADRQWTLIFHPQVNQGQVLPIRASWIILTLGLLLSVFIVLYTARLVTAEARLERLVDERTRDLRETLEQLQQAQKMEAVGRLTGGIAHDFNNLLTIVMGNISLARDAIADRQVQTTLLDPALAAAERGADLTQRLLAFSRRQALQPRVVVVADLARGMRPLIERTLGADITLEVVADAAAWRIRVDPSQLEAALLNLCINARDAMPTGGTISLIIENTQLSAGPARAPDDVVAGDYVLVSVADNGEGMTDDVRARAFEPFYTTKGVGKGSGLGLSMVFGFVKQSSGHIAIDSVPGHGTTVRMYFPRARE